MAKKPLKDKISYRCYRILRWFVWLFYPKIEIVGTEHLPDEPCLIVGNHAKMNGPIIGELYVPGNRAIWCAGEMMRLKDVPAYAYQDFWSGKPKGIRWFYKLLSYLITPLSVCIFNNAHTIGVYKDSRILSTFKETVRVLESGAGVVIFPEHDVPDNDILCEFQDRFVDVAKMYYRRTGQELPFVPMYVAPSLGKLYFGPPVTFRHDAPIEDERRRIAGAMSESITALARSLPRHTVVPYRNIPKRDYPENLPKEEQTHEKTNG